MLPLRLIVGLGNPGPDYHATRHNLGFWLIDRLAHQQGFPLQPQSKFQGIVGRQGETYFLQPQTFMNRSGQSVSALAHFYRIPPPSILIVHDDLDLPPGEIRLKQGGSHGGHNGLKDIQNHLGTPDFWRLRLGIGHPRTLGLQQAVADFVLHPPRSTEQAAIDHAIERCLQTWPQLISGDLASAQRQLHSKPQEGKPS